MDVPAAVLVALLGRSPLHLPTQLQRRHLVHLAETGEGGGEVRDPSFSGGDVDGISESGITIW